MFEITNNIPGTIPIELRRLDGTPFLVLLDFGVPYRFVGDIKNLPVVTANFVEKGYVSISKVPTNLPEGTLIGQSSGSITGMDGGGWNLFSANWTSANRDDGVLDVAPGTTIKLFPSDLHAPHYGTWRYTTDLSFPSEGSSLLTEAGFTVPDSGSNDPLLLTYYVDNSSDYGAGTGQVAVARAVRVTRTVSFPTIALTGTEVKINNVPSGVSVVVRGYLYTGPTANTSLYPFNVPQDGWDINTHGFGWLSPEQWHRDVPRNFNEPGNYVLPRPDYPFYVKVDVFSTTIPLLPVVAYGLFNGEPAVGSPELWAMDGYSVFGVLPVSRQRVKVITPWTIS